MTQIDTRLSAVNHVTERGTFIDRAFAPPLLPSGNEFDGSPSKLGYPCPTPRISAAVVDR